MQWLDRMLRGALPASAVILLLVVSEANALSTADLIEFPIVAPAELDLSTDAISLSKGTGYEFSLSRIGVHNPSGNQPEAGVPDTWTLLTYSATVTYLPGAIADEVYEPSDLDLLLVMTSLREGSYQPGDPLPPRLNAGYIRTSLGDDDFLFVYDPPGGTIIDGEGDTFLAFRFPALVGVPQTFSYEIAVRETLGDTLQHFHRGYVAQTSAPVPEPKTAMWIATLIIGVWVIRRERFS